MLDAVAERSIPIATLLVEARPSGLDDDTLTIEFAPGADFHRAQVEDPKNLRAAPRRALRGDRPPARDRDRRRRRRGRTPTRADDEPLSEEDVISLLKDTFDANEVEEH